MKSAISTALFVIVLISMVATAVLADIPTTMSYQAVLRDGTGTPVSDGTYQVTFRLYDVETGGAALWEETQLLEAEGGIVNASLGSVVPLNTLDFMDPYWLGISVEGEAELAPRTALQTVPYAGHAGFADTCLEGDQDWVIDGDDVYHDLGNVGIGIAPSDARLDVVTSAQKAASFANAGSGDLSTIQASNVNGTVGSFYSNAQPTTYSAYPTALYAYALSGAYGANIWSSEAIGAQIQTNSGSTALRAKTFGSGYSGEFLGGDGVYVEGNVRMDSFEMPTGSAAGRVLTSDSSGSGTWQEVAGFSLPYEGFGSVPETTAVFKVWNSGTGSAIYGQNTNLVGGTAGYLADTFYGAFGQHFESGNFGYLGGHYYGVYGKNRGVEGAAIYGRHDPSSNTATLGSPTHAGYFLGDVAVTNGALGVGTDTPSEELEVEGEVEITSQQSGPALDVRKTYNGSVGQSVNFDKTQEAAPGNDILELSATAASPNNFQFIECDRGGTVEWGVNGDGTTFTRGSYVSGDARLCEMMAVAGGARAAEPGDVMVIDPGAGRTLSRSREARSTLVAGVYTRDAAIVGSSRGWVRSEGRSDDSRATYDVEDMAAEFGEIPLAVVGVVSCKVSTENGPIRPGDLLVTSKTPGHAMRDESPAPGTILGKALEALESGTGLIDVLVTLQ